MSKSILTHEYLRNNLHYSIITGQFFWIKTGKNRILSKESGSYEGGGYRRIKINGKPYKSHRLAWLWVTGEWPKHEIDHKNGVKDANQWLNLREATRSQNECNKGLRSDNTSGFKGVSWDKREGKWMSYIVLNKKHKTLGYFSTPELANEKRISVESQYHGDFAKT